MSYLAYHFTVQPPEPGSEILMALIADLGFESFDTTETGFTAYINSEQAGEIVLTAFNFDDFTYTYSIEHIETVNWNAEWEKNFEPVWVDDLLCIRAPFHEKASGAAHEIVIMPKMSFGTGHHQTTRLMCRHLFSMDLRGSRVLDMGCGTGILAILARMLGSGEVLGIDIDAWSVENAKENCAMNGCSDIPVLEGDVDLLAGQAPFDVILANINKNILKVQIPAYASVIRPGGTLLLSGFFTTDVEELSEVAGRHGFTFLQSRQENEWAMMVLQK